MLGAPRGPHFFLNKRVIHNAPRGAMWITLGFLKKFGPLGALKQFLQSKTNLHHLSSVIKCFKQRKKIKITIILEKKDVNANDTKISVLD